MSKNADSLSLENILGDVDNGRLSLDEVFAGFDPRQRKFDPNLGKKMTEAKAREPQPPVFEFPEKFPFGNSQTFQDVLRKAMNEGVDSLPDEMKKQVQLAASNFPRLHSMLQKAQEEADDPGTLGERITGYYKDVAKGDPLSPVKAPIKTASDAIATWFDPSVKDWTKSVGKIPWRLDPDRDLTTDPPTDDELAAHRAWEKLPGEYKLGAACSRMALGALGGVFQFITQGADPIVNPDKYGTTMPEAIDETAGGFADMFLLAPDQISYLAAQVYGTPENTISKLMDGLGYVATLPMQIPGVKTEAGLSREEIKKLARDHFYKNPETLVFVGTMLRGFGKKVNLRKDAGTQALNAEIEAMSKIGPQAEYMVVKRGELEKTVGEAEKVRQEASERATGLGEQVKSAEASAKIIEAELTKLEKEAANIAVEEANLRQSRAGGEKLKSDLEIEQAEAKLEQHRKDFASSMESAKGELQSLRGKDKKPTEPKLVEEPKPVEVEPVKPEIKPEPDAGDVFEGQAFRTESGLLVRGKSAREIVDFESAELGNIDVLKDAEAAAKKHGLDLKSIPEEDVVWVTRTKKDAARYYEGDAQPYDVPEGSVILAVDGDGGFLVHLKRKKVEPKVKKTVTEKSLTPESVAKELGIIYNGMQPQAKGKPPAAMFTDTRKGKETSFTVPDLSKAKEKLAAKRKEMDAGEKIKAEPTIETMEAEGLEANVKINQKLRHAKRFVKSLEERINEKGVSPEQKKIFEKQMVEAKAEEVKYQAQFDEIRARTEIADQLPDVVEPSEIIYMQSGLSPEVFKKKKSTTRLKAEEEFLGIKRDVKAEVYGTTDTVRRWTKEYSGLEREDAGAVVESINNLRTKKAPKRTARVMKLVEEYKKAQEAIRRKINEFLKEVTGDEYISWLENYLPHFYVGNMKSAGNKLMNSPNAKARKIPTLQEAVDAGLTPLSQDVAVLHAKWADINWAVAANKRLAKMFKEIKTPEGGPAVVSGTKPATDWVHFNHPALNRVFAQKTADGKVTLREGGVWIHPEIVPAAKQAFENPYADRGSIARTYDVLSSFAKTAALTASGFHFGALTESAQAVLARGRKPFAGIITVGRREGSNWPFRATFREGKLIQKNNPAAVQDMIRHGYQLESKRNDAGFNVVQESLQKLEARTRRIPVAGGVTRYVRKAFDLTDWALWQQVHEGYKVYSYERVLTEAITRLPKDLSPQVYAQVTKVIKQEIAQLLNSAFGGQEWESKFWLSPKGLLVARRTLLAPDWTYSNLDIAAQALISVGKSIEPRPKGTKRIGTGLTEEIPATVSVDGVRQRVAKHITLRYWRNMTLSVYGVTQAINYATTGHSTYSNEVGHKMDIDITPIRKAIDEQFAKVIPGYDYDPEDKQRYYVRIGKQAREIISWIESPDKIFGSKMNPVAREIAKQVTGYQVGGFKSTWTEEDLNAYESVPERMKSIAGMFVPFSFRGNNFAFTLPMSKGMTPYKGIRAYQEALDSRTWSIFGDKKTEPEAIKAITQALIDNGHNPKPVYVAALGAVRGKYYTAYFEAFEKGDIEKLNEVSTRLDELGATKETLIQSGKRRGIIK